MKTKLWMGLGIAALVIGSIACTSSPESSASAGGTSSPGGSAATVSRLAGETSVTSGITVNGEGEVTGDPDVAYITLGVETSRPTAQEAQAENARLMTAVIAKLESLEVDKKDMHTSGLSLHPIRNKDREIIEYQASNQVRVTVQNIARTGELMDAAVEAGANVGGQISFGFKDDTSMRLEALESAVTAAREKAETIARGLGVSIIGIESATEEYGYSPRPVYAEAAIRAPDTTPVLPGELTVTARVKVVYSYQ